MKHSTKKQRGQALILIVFAIVGMIGLTALAVDGGNAYSDRRHAQNAADTAALAAALSKVNGADETTWIQAGMNIAASNGYTDGANGASVSVRSCSPQPNPPCVLGADQDPANFIQVVITSTVHTYFAPVLGIHEITNNVEAIAKAIPTEPTTWFNGSALVALMPGCKYPGWNADPFTISGTQISVVNGNGVLVNSTCSNAFVQNGNNSFTAPGGICVVGGTPGGLQNVTPLPQTNCPNSVDPNKYVLPPLEYPKSCEGEGNNGNGYIEDKGTYLLAHPGVYTSTFPPGPSGDLRLMQGIYCLNRGISIQGGWNITTELDSPPDGYQPYEGVLLFVNNGGVNISGGSSIYLHAINTTSTGLGADLTGYLLYLPPTNPSSVQLTGGASTTYVSTILAPASLVTLSGGNSAGNTLNLQTQVIGYSVTLTGSGNLNITYNQSQNATTYTKPQLTPYK